MTKLLRSFAFATTAVSVGVLGVLSAAPAYAATVTVCAIGCDHTTIQDAVTAAAGGDTINIAAGTYNESITIDKSLTLVGPNATTSPNTGDPLVVNGARAAEAILTPPSGDGIHAIALTNTATDVTISGLTFDLTGSVYVANGQKYINATTAAGNGSLTLTNNIFTDAPANLEGELVYKTQTGDSTITITNNRFTNGGTSNGVYLNNSSVGATMTLNITDNVWLDNGYLAGNFSSDSGSVIVGTVSNNWIGNSTAGTSGVDNYDTRQGGFVLAGVYDGFSLTDNDFTDIEDSALLFWNGFGGTMNITGNEFDGYSNVSGYAAIRVSPGSPLSDLSGINFTGNSITNPTAGSLAVLNSGDSGIFDARGNWWGDAMPLFNTLVNLSNVEDPSDFTVLVDDWLTSWGAAEAGPGLADTGADINPALLAGGAAMLLLGCWTVFVARRLRQNN